MKNGGEEMKKEFCIKTNAKSLPKILLFLVEDQTYCDSMRFDEMLGTIKIS